MNTRVRIMDMEMDLLPQETFQDELQAYLSGDSLRVVHMVSLDYIDAYEENELLKEVLAQADLVLPGERAILLAHHVDVLETAGMVIDYKSLFALPASLLDKKSVYLVLRDEKEIRAVKTWLSRYFSGKAVVGTFAADKDVTEETLINDINTKLPDIIILSMDSTWQEEWLSKNKNRMNAKVCLVLGSILPLIMRDYVRIPRWIRKIHLGGVFRFLTRIPYSHFFRKRIFHRRMDDYITKKKWEGNVSDDKIQKDD